MLAVIIAAYCGTIVYIVSIVKPDSQTVLNKWPIEFINDFSRQIIFMDGRPQIADAGLESLKKDGLWLQIIDGSGYEVFVMESRPPLRDITARRDCWNYTRLAAMLITHHSSEVSHTMAGNGHI